MFDEKVFVHHWIEAKVLPAFDDVVLGLLKSEGGNCGGQQEASGVEKMALVKL